jgi:hypothetical protein
MKNQLILCSLLAAAPILQAQDQQPPAGLEMPNPKHEEHEALAALAGTWEFVMKNEAMPGVPGMEEATESKGTERAELCCNGLWLKSQFDSVWQGEPFQGVWLAGYDPFKKKYVSIWVSSSPEEPGAATMDGAYDAKTKTWTWSGTTPHGEMRSVLTLRNADQTVETCYMKSPDGKEAKCMEITRKRSKVAPVAANATARGIATENLTAELQVLHKDIGEWQATLKMSAPGMPASEDRCTERVISTCDGRWLWSDFRGNVMGMPFEGHGLIGYDTQKNEYVSYWIDSMTPALARTTGTFDPTKRAYVLTGASVDQAGQPMKIRQVLTWKGDDARVLKMEFESAGTVSNMEIDYRRKAK